VLTHRTLIRNILGAARNWFEITSRRIAAAAESAKKDTPNSLRSKVAENKIIMKYRRPSEQEWGILTVVMRYNTGL